MLMILILNKRHQALFREILESVLALHLKESLIIHNKDSSGSYDVLKADCVSETLQFISDLSHARLFVTTWPAAHQASLSVTNSRSVLKLMSMESGMPSNLLILCCPLLLLPSLFPNIRVFSNESVLHIRWPKYWNFSLSISPSVNIQDCFLLELTGLIFFQSEGLSRVFSNTIIQKHKLFSAQLSLQSNSHIHT